jgi:soluble lytic murein transglycosylase-like protein
MDHKALEVSIDPEVKILKEYQKLRNSRIPIEIAKLQAELIVEVAHESGLPVELLVGIISAETAHTFDASAVSGVGAVGLMQILQGQNEAGEEIEISEEKKFDIQYNLQIGCAILKGKLKKTDGNLYRALQMYSGGADRYPERVYEGVGRYVMYRSTVEEIKIVKR